MALFEFNIHNDVDVSGVVQRLTSIEARLGIIEVNLKTLQTQGAKTMSTVQDLVDAVAEVKTAVGQIPAAVDALEAKITEIGKRVGLSPEDQAALDQAVTDLRDVVGTANAAAADAGDGVDEAAIVPTP